MFSVKRNLPTTPYNNEMTRTIMCLSIDMLAFGGILHLAFWCLEGL